MKIFKIALLLCTPLLLLSCAKNSPLNEDDPELVGTDKIVEIHLSYGKHADKFNLLTSYQVIKADGALPSDFQVSGISSEPAIDLPVSKVYYIEDRPLTQSEVTYITSHPVSEAGILLLLTSDDPAFSELDVTVTFRVAGKVVDSPRVLTLTTDLEKVQGLSVDNARPGKLSEPED